MTSALNSLAVQRNQIRVVADNVPPQQRRVRRPQHPFNLKFKPYEIVPMQIIPVLPGDTLDSALVQFTCVTDPMQNRLIGAHVEIHAFYVKHRGLALWDTTGLLQSMMLDPSTDVSSLKAAANNVPYYTFKSGMDFVKQCHRAVVTEFFRDEGETWDADLVENYPCAQINQESWLHSLKEESATGDDTDTRTYRPLLLNAGSTEESTATWSTSAFATDVHRRRCAEWHQLPTRSFQNFLEVSARDHGRRRCHLRLRQRRPHGPLLHERRRVERSDVERRSRR